MIWKMVIHFEKMKSGFWKTWLGNDKRKSMKIVLSPGLPGGIGAHRRPFPPATPLTPAIRGLGPPPGTPRLYLESRRAAEKLIFEKFHKNVIYVWFCTFFGKKYVCRLMINLGNLKNLAYRGWITLWFWSKFFEIFRTLIEILNFQIFIRELGFHLFRKWLWKRRWFPFNF